MAVLAPVVGGSNRPEVADDLLRGAVVLGASALDAFVHHVFSQRFVPYVRKTPASMTQGQALYSYLKSIGVPAAGLKLPAPVNGHRPLAATRAIVDRRLFLKPLQDVGAIDKALGAIGLGSAISAIAAAQGLKEATLRARITKITRRRNSVAHEGDLFRGKKKRFVSRPVSETEVELWLDRIDDFVQRLDSYVNANPP